MRVYFISGMGADRRVFKHIVLPAGFEIVHLDWIAAFKNESLESYSKRLSEKIIPNERFVLLGLSMGGMIASEIAKQLSVNTALVILISSVPSHKHLPYYFKISATIGLHNLVPVRMLKSATLLNRFFANDNKEDLAVLTQVVKESDPLFIKWALQAVPGWKNETIPSPLWHIHGTKDRILPIRFTKPTHVISDGNHLMIMNKAKDLNRFIEAALATIQL